jgi:hypothetical protein
MRHVLINQVKKLIENVFAGCGADNGFHLAAALWRFFSR